MTTYILIVNGTRSKPLDATEAQDAAARLRAAGITGWQLIPYERGGGSMTTENRNWTPEPWSIYASTRIQAMEHITIAETCLYRPSRWEGHKVNEPERDANAERIVATVNACAPDGPVAALVAAVEATSGLYCDRTCVEHSDVWKRLDEALAAVREQLGISN